MLKLVYKYFISSLVLCFFTSCVDMTDNQLGVNGEDSSYITFDISELETKVSNEDIKGQEFAIWIYDSEHRDVNNPLVDGTKYHLKWDDNNNKWRFYDTTNQNPKDIPWGVGKHNFFAYNYFKYEDNIREHNYTKSTATFALPYNLDLTATGSNGKKNYYNDVICANATRSDPTTDRTPVSLTFKHVFAALEFTVNNETDEIKTISEFKIYRFGKHLDSRADISFNTGKPLSWNTPWNENYNYTADTLIVRPKRSRTIFGSPVMVIPQSWDANESNQIDYHIPKLTMTIKTGDEETGETIQKDFKDFFGETTALEGGKLYSFDINLKSLLPVYIQNVSSQITHEYPDNTLSHSKVILKLGLTDKELALIEKLKVTVTGNNGAVLAQEFATVTEEVTVSNGTTYLPQGTYNITLEYSDKGGTNHKVEIDSVLSPAPVYNMTVNLSATATGCTVTSVDVVGISNNLLTKYGLNGSIRLTGTTNETEITSSKFSSSNTLNDTPFTDNESQSLYFKISTDISFDNAQPTVNYNCSGCSVADNKIYVVIPDPNVGDYFYSDGTYSSTYNSSKELLGIVFYVADENDENTYPTTIDKELGTDYPNCTRGLVMGIPSGTYGTPFNSSYPISSMWGEKAVICNTMGDVTGVVSGVYDKMTGYSNTVNAKEQAPSGKTVNCLNELNRPTVTDVTSSWYLPTIAECDKIRALNETINKRLSDAEKNTLPNTGNYCVTLSEDTAKYWVAYDLAYTGEASAYSSYMKTYQRTTWSTNCYVVPILAF